MAHWMAEEAREQHALGMACSFDCGDCERRSMRHEHPTICGHGQGYDALTGTPGVVVCYSESCFMDGATEEPLPCALCRPIPEPLYPLADTVVSDWGNDEPPF